MINNFVTFEKTFAIDIGFGKNKKEVDELKTIHDHFFNKN